jgi:hypothetical protein
MKLKPVLMNKKTHFKTSFSYFIGFSFISDSDLKQSEKLVFFACVFFYQNPIQVEGKI